MLEQFYCLFGFVFRELDEFDVNKLDDYTLQVENVVVVLNKEAVSQDATKEESMDISAPQAFKLSGTACVSWYLEDEELGSYLVSLLKDNF